MSDFTKKPHVPMTGRTIKVYSEAVWNHWLSYKYGDDVVRKTWEKSPKKILLRGCGTNIRSLQLSSMAAPDPTSALQRLRDADIGVAVGCGGRRLGSGPVPAVTSSRCIQLD